MHTMIYLRAKQAPYKWMVVGKMYKIAANKATPFTYYGLPKFFFTVLSNVEVLIACRKEGITLDQIPSIPS